MLYKVTPMMPEEAPKPKKEPREPGQPRKKRRSAIYDADGAEVLITLMCLKCHKMKPLMQFGLRKMADGAIRNQPWCRTCRSVAGAPKPKPEVAAEAGPSDPGCKDLPVRATLGANGDGEAAPSASEPISAEEPIHSDSARGDGAVGDPEAPPVEIIARPEI